MRRRLAIATMERPSVATLLGLLLLAASLGQVGGVSQLTLHLPSEYTSLPGGELRVDYSPPVGDPGPNFTFPATDSVEGVPIDGVLPGTDYNFQLYLSNGTVNNHRLWSSVIETGQPNYRAPLPVPNYQGYQPGHAVQTAPPPSSLYPSHYHQPQLANTPPPQPPPPLYPVYNPLAATAGRCAGPLPEPGCPAPSTRPHPRSLPVSLPIRAAALSSDDIIAEPDPPTNLSIKIDTGKVAHVYWQPPAEGKITGYRLAISPLSDQDEAPERSVHLNDENPPYTLRELTPGGTYQLQLFSVYKSRESQQSAASNFTTKPNAPGRFIVWFRNETTLLVLWQPPYPSGIFDQYLVSITPEDASQSILYVDKEGEPPGPAQAPFYGLVPGRAYNISVQTISQTQISAPTEAQYRTVPLPPSNVTFNKEKVTSRSFEVSWSPPKSFSEFDRYQVALSMQHSLRQIVGRDEDRVAIFDQDLEPGRTYEVMVKTVSGNVASWPVMGNVTTHPLSVEDLNATYGDAGEILVRWKPNNASLQDAYMVRYNELESFNSDSLETVKNNSVLLKGLLQGRNYSISVVAVSKGVASQPVFTYQSTRPASPVIEALEPVGQHMNVSWKSDVTSRQDSFAVVYVRNDTGERRQEDTRQNWLLLNNLYPGASYQIRVYAVSHGLWSEPHSYYQTVAPRPPQNLQIVKASNSTVILTWNAPANSLVDHYAVRYRPIESTYWREFGVVNSTSAEIDDLIAGERYVVRVATVSNKVESTDAQDVEQTLYPNSIKHVTHFLDSQNITFEWTAPPGRVDYYIIVYNPLNDQKKQKSQQVPANITRPGDNVNVVIENLKPGELYSFRLYAVSHDVRSEGFGVQTRTMPVIDSVINIVADEHETRTLGIKYTPTPQRHVVFDRYRFQLSDTGIPAQEKLSNDTNRLVLFDNLVPGRLYNISIWTISGGVYSVPIYRHTRLFPDPVKEIKALTVTDTAISLVWESATGDRDGYEVQYLDHRGVLVQNFTLGERISYEHLRPHHNYTFVVAVMSGYDTSTVRRSLPMSRTFQTLESVPGKVQNFQPFELKPSEIVLQWSLPSSEQNGVLTGFKITYYMKGSLTYRHKLFEPTETKGVISNLIPGRTYVFEIQAHTKIGPGGKGKWEQTMPIWAPPKPSDSVFPKSVTHTTATIRVSFRKNFFANSHGPIHAYTLIVAEDVSKDAASANLPTWSEVQSFHSWPPYQVTEPYYPFNGTLTEDFVIGSEDCKGDKGYCNGPLKPGSTYRVKVRAYTAPDKFTDTVYSYPIQTDPDNTPLIVGILVPLSLLVILAVLLVFLRRRRLGPFAPHSRGDPHSKDHDIVSIAESEMITSRPVKLKDFLEHYRIMSADSDFRFSEEFELLKHVGRDKPCGAADLPVNRPKNRFTNILPYDHSRVKLLPTDDEDGSDYINANYIPGFNSPREFIVTQGPLHSTRDDMWRMVWEQNCRAIVMLTRCIEKGREKCDHYWPFDTQPVYYGDIQVTILNESQYADWTISEFKVSRGDQSRIVRHFHFTTWPDFGVPDPPQTLVKFVRAFRERVIPDTKPIVVHCSAGVGRSGTFIALDRILQGLRKYDTVDIFGIVYEMRRERVWMVQNEQQYICIHQCLMCVLEGKEDVLDSPRPEAHDNQGFEARSY
ncbi:protein tyrosine phosphatase 10D isoform X2 [Dermacentor variabilis]|uniref:protein tyrosine phosphatase 10D isoform X2 n=1 Tax=Dermacentor variabilis TaxID=34621 RepID=UPI003F5CB620